MSDPRPEPLDEPAALAADGRRDLLTPAAVDGAAAVDDHDVDDDLDEARETEDDESDDETEETEAAEPEVPRLEVAAVATLLGSVVLGLVTATEKVAPVAWVAGMVMVLLSRRWGPAEKGLALLAFGILGVPFVVLGRDELRAPASVVTGIVLAALWLGSAAWLLRRSRAGRVEGRGLRMR